MDEQDQSDTGKCGFNGTIEPQGVISEAPAPGLTLAGLIEEYRTHKASTFHKLAYDNRKNTRRMTERLDEQYGSTPLADIRASTIRIWHDGWSEGGKISMAHSFVALLRTMLGFGLLMLEDRECERLCVTLNKLKFPQHKQCEVTLLPEQADAIREAARRHFGWYSIALAQAFQFELVLRQRDVIGQWLPESEPGDSDIRYNGLKWCAGIRWSEVADDMVLRHITNKRKKPMAADLKLCPMIQEELSHITYRSPGGPIIINDVTGLPWSANEFRRKWRLVANHCGIPKEVKDMHSRSGGISEMFRAGVRPDAIQRIATHSDLSMTMKYNRQNHLDTQSEGQLTRLEYRNRKAGE
jgi:hypothetical protein